MKTSSTYTDTSYRLSQLIMVLLTLSALTVMINFDVIIARYLFGFPIVLAGCLGIVGSYVLYKGRYEPFNEKKVIAIIVNTAMVLLIMTILLSNTLY
ncbi:MAG: hypothetical protein HKN89_10310 [Eudoraea sp.]|nr:hypothetical protein [Eudoraea sp.]